MSDHIVDANKLVLPPPPVPADCDLTGMWFPFDTRIRDSPQFLVFSPEECKAWMMLRLQSWLRKPAGSLPDDARELAKLSMAGRKWKRVAPAAMHGWYKASDGLSYNPEIVPLVMKAWSARLKIMSRINRRLMMESGEWAAIRSKIFARDNYTCAYCGARGVALECDHIVPLSKGGPTTEDNLVTACKQCNRSKGAKPVKEWKP